MSPVVKLARKLREPLPEKVTTTIFISNLHCSSCVASIQEALDNLRPTPEFIAHSIISHSVVLCHKRSLALEVIVKTIEHAGFEVHSIFQDQPAKHEPVEVRQPHDRDAEWQLSLDRAVSKWRRKSRLFSLVAGPASEADAMRKQAEHIRSCDDCQEEGADLEKPYILEKPQPVVVHTKKASISTLDGPFMLRDDSLIVVDSLEEEVYKAIISITGMTCSSCVSSITHAVEQLPYVRSVDVNLLTNTGTVIFDCKRHIDEVVSTIEDAGFDARVEALEEYEHPGAAEKLQKSKRWRATYAVGGMTCSSCVGHVTEAIEQHPWVETVEVNLLSNSATVVFAGKEHAPEIQETVEDAGFEATLDNIIPEEATKIDVFERTVAIRIDGMFCPDCPKRVMRELTEMYGDMQKFEILSPPLTEKAPIIHIKYIPHPPGFTIRHIVQTIRDLNPSFDPSIYHPPTIEDRAREMQLLERRRTLFRLVLSIIVAIPTFLIGIVFMSLISSKHPIRRYIMQPMWIGNVTRATWALFILATPVYFFAADTFHTRMLKEIRAMWRPGSRVPYLQRFYRFGSMNMLISLGTSIAYFASIAELGLAATKQSEGSMSDSYFDAVVFLTMFLLIGRFLEAYSKAKTGDAVTSLGALRPSEAVLVAETGDMTLATDLLEIGDVVRVHHGTSPPFDGIIVDGTTIFDESSLTGESRPVRKENGDTVYSGTINKGSPVQIQITSVSGTSMLDQIIAVVREGQTRRAPVERVADTITAHFVPFVVSIAITTWITWLSLGKSGAIPADWKTEGSGGWELWSLRFAIAVFVIACPCGIGLAAPTALFVGGGLAAKYGILVKGGGEAFQEASGLDCVVFDKTGTLTMGGDPAVTEHAFAGTEEQSVVLGLMKALEENSNHPIAQALVKFCNSRETKTPSVLDVDEVPGKGLKGRFRLSDSDDGEIEAIIGNEAFMKDHNALITPYQAATLQTWKSRGESVALLAISRPSASEMWHLAALFGIADPLRPEAPSVIRALQERGIDVWMLSGDNATTANAVGLQVGIPPQNIIAGVLPDQKAEKIKYLQRSLTKRSSRSLFRWLPCISRGGKAKTKEKRATVAMIGDGINDAPALSTADLSIAIGSGSDIALSSSSFILITSNLETLLTLLDLSKKVFRRVYFNFLWAGMYNIIAMPVAAGVLYPITTGGKEEMGMHHNGVGMEGGMGMGESGEKHVRLDPVWAALAMALSSVSVVCSSLLLRTRVPGVGFRVKGEKK